MRDDYPDLPTLSSNWRRNIAQPVSDGALPRGPDRDPARGRLVIDDLDTSRRQRVTIGGAAHADNLGKNHKPAVQTSTASDAGEQRVIPGCTEEAARSMSASRI